MGGGTMLNRVIVQRAGFGYRLQGSLMQQEINRKVTLLSLDRLPSNELSMT
jgi:hypothetical protein